MNRPLYQIISTDTKSEHYWTGNLLYTSQEHARELARLADRDTPSILHTVVPVWPTPANPDRAWIQAYIITSVIAAGLMAAYIYLDL